MIWKIEVGSYWTYTRFLYEHADGEGKSMRDGAYLPSNEAAIDG